MSPAEGDSRLQEIPVRVESRDFTQNVTPLLHEVRHALDRLLQNGAETTIDLGAIPLAPGELERIDEVLGEGEVRVTLEALGPSEIHETKYPGVWRITHCNTTEQVVGRYIEIARIPSLLLAQKPDMQRALEQLSQSLGSQSS